MALKKATVSTTCHWVSGRMSTTCHWDMRRMSRTCHWNSETVHNSSFKLWDSTKRVTIKPILGSLIFSMTSFGQSRSFSDKLWTVSLFEWQVPDILLLSQWQIVESSHKLNDKFRTQSVAFFRAINCKEFEIKAKIIVEKELFHSFHHAHCIPEAFLHHICRNSSSCDGPFKECMKN